MTPDDPELPAQAPSPLPSQPVGGWGLGLPPGVHPMSVARPDAASEPLAVLSLVIGILSIFSSWCCLGMLLGPAGIVLAAIALSRSPRGARGLAIAGLATSLAGLALWGLIQVAGLALSFWRPMP